jgi:hypothetical protein
LSILLLLVVVVAVPQEITMQGKEVEVLVV